MRLEPITHDERGESWRVVFPDDREMLLIFTRKGYLRGGHSHDVREVTMLLSGRLRYYKKFSEAAQERTIEMRPGDCNVNEPGEVHMALALEDYWMLDWKIDVRAGESRTTNYEPYRSMVRESGRTFSLP